jgi:Protein of unknown function (DUF3179)
MNPTRSRAAWLVTTLCALIVIATLAVPMYVIRPFVPQDARALALALTVRGAAPWLSAVCAILALGVVIWAWRALRLGGKIILPLLLIVMAAGAYVTHINIFEVMFKPYPSPVFGPANEVKVDADDKVLAVTVNGESHAYPIRTMGYHHIVNDFVAGQPIAVTYCTLCHTGLVWSRVFTLPDEKEPSTLTFRLGGINNGNAVLRDEQTNSIWQQSTGEAIFGPLKGQHLDLIHSDELTFALWRAEQPNGVVLKPEAPYEAEYDPKDWEAHVERTHTVVDTSQSGIGPHELMLGVQTHWGSPSKAYPVKSILNSGLIEDRVGDDPVLIVVGPDHASMRVFRAQLSDETTPLTFVRTAAPDPDVLMTDTESSSTWNFHGCAVSGKYKGRCLRPIDSHKDFWFDWLNHNPSTTVFRN